MRRVLGVGISLWALAAALPAQAQDKKDDAQQDSTITVTATRIPTDVKEVPATVTVIDERRMADELTTDIKDLVRYEPGISVPRGPTRFGAAQGTTGRAGNEGFVIRGIGGNRVLIQVDGVRMPDGFSFGAQSTGRGDYVDLGLVKSVEILRGPASALYGSDGLAGAISFTTSDPSDFLRDGKKVAGLARAAYSSADDEFSETGIIAGGFGDLSAMVAYTRRDYHELDNKGTTGGIGTARTEPNPQDGHSNAALGRLVYEPDTHNRFRITGEYVDSRLSTNVLTGLTALPAPVGSTTIDLLQARDTSKRGRIAGDWTWNGEGTLEFARLSGWWQNSKDRQFTDEDRSPVADRERLNTFENRVYGASGEVRFGFGADDGLRGKLTLAGDISWTNQKGLRDGVTPPAGETFPTRAFPETDYMLAGLVAAAEVTFGPLTLYPALRFDAYKLTPEKDPLLPTFVASGQDGSRVSPKVGAVIKLSEGVRLFANYAQGFKAPEPSQVNNFFANPPVGYTSISNPNLKPETSESFEGGLRYFNDFVSFDVTGFYARYHDFIDQVETTGRPFPSPAAPWIYQWRNLGGVKIRGFEARTEVRPAKGVTATLALSYAKGDTIATNGAKLPLQSIDPLKVVGGLGYDAEDRGFGGRVMATYGGQKEIARTRGSSCYATTANAVPNCFTGNDFVTFDITAYVRVTNDVTLRGGVFNLTDRKYWLWQDIRGLAANSAVRDAYTQPGRNGSVSISYRF
jgi:hemoglobin/transferrin/lactoferrin receptor protein